MSGGGSGMPIYSGSEEIKCEDLNLTITLSTPIQLVIATLNISDTLEVRAYSNLGPIQVIDSLGRLAGNILSKNQKKLLDCLINGTEYSAEVMEIKGAFCKVKIYHS